MPRPPLLATSDDALLDDLLRLAAAAGLTPEVAGDAGAALRSWARAPAVLVGGDLLPAVARMRPPRRDDVGVVLGPGATWAAADVLAVGAAWLADLPREEASVVAALGDLAEPSGAGALVVVTGGSGGAGASVLAAALALRGAGLGPTLLVDLDPLGAGLERLVGPVVGDPAPGVGQGAAAGWVDLGGATGRIGGAALRDAVPRSPDGVGVLGWAAAAPEPPPTDVVREALAAGVRGHAAVVVDLPRTALADPDGGAAQVMARADAVVLAAVATLPGLAAATRALRRGPLAEAEPLLVVRGTPQARDGAARVLGCQPVAVEADQPGLDDDLALGVLPVPVGGRAPRGRRGALARSADAVWGATSALLGDRGAR